MLIWITGISGAGKTTIARCLYERLKQKYPNLVYLDGDEFRKAMGGDLGYTLEDRDKNAVRMTGLCKLLYSQGIHVICGANLTSQRFRDWCRENIPGYFEVYLEAPLNVLMRRDKKGIYAERLVGKGDPVVGFDISYDAPNHPDLIIDNSTDRDSFNEIADRIIASTGL